MNAIIQISTSTSGTVTATDTQQDVILVHDAGVTLTLTVAFPANPKDGQIFIVTSAGGITTLSLTAVVGTIVGALTTITSTTPGRYIYSVAQNKWFRF